MRTKAIIFDWARTLFDREKFEIFPEAEEVLKYCQEKGYRLALVSYVSTVSPDSYTNLEGRKKEIESSPLRKYFEIALATDIDKNEIFEEVVKHFGLPRNEIMIVGDRTKRDVKYGNDYGHPTVWLQKGLFADQLPNEETGQPSHTIHELKELLNII